MNRVGKEDTGSQVDRKNDGSLAASKEDKQRVKRAKSSGRRGGRSEYKQLSGRVIRQSQGDCPPPPPPPGRTLVYSRLISWANISRLEYIVGCEESCQGNDQLESATNLPGAENKPGPCVPGGYLWGAVNRPLQQKQHMRVDERTTKRIPLGILALKRTTAT